MPSKYFFPAVTVIYASSRAAQCSFISVQLLFLRTGAFMTILTIITVTQMMIIMNTEPAHKIQNYLKNRLDQEEG